MRYAKNFLPSIRQPEAFWAEQAKAIGWHVPPQGILDDSRRSALDAGQTCYNATTPASTATWPNCGDQYAPLQVAVSTRQLCALSRAAPRGERCSPR